MKKILLIVFVFCPVFASYGMMSNTEKNLIKKNNKITELKNIVEELKEEIIKLNTSSKNDKSSFNKLFGKMQDVNAKLRKTIGKLSINKKDLQRLVEELKKELVKKESKDFRKDQIRTNLAREFEKLKEELTKYQQKDISEKTVNKLLVKKNKSGTSACKMAAGVGAGAVGMIVTVLVIILLFDHYALENDSDWFSRVSTT